MGVTNTDVSVARSLVCEMPRTSCPLYAVEIEPVSSDTTAPSPTRAFLVFRRPEHLLSILQACTRPTDYHHSNAPLVQVRPTVGQHVLLGDEDADQQRKQ